MINVFHGFSCYCSRTGCCFYSPDLFKRFSFPQGFVLSHFSSLCVVFCCSLYLDDFMCVTCVQFSPHASSSQLKPTGDVSASAKVGIHSTKRSYTVMYFSVTWICCLRWQQLRRSWSVWEHLIGWCQRSARWGQTSLSRENKPAVDRKPEDGGQKRCQEPPQCPRPAADEGTTVLNQRVEKQWKHEELNVQQSDGTLNWTDVFRWAQEVKSPTFKHLTQCWWAFSSTLAYLQPYKTIESFSGSWTMMPYLNSQLL